MSNGYSGLCEMIIFLLKQQCQHPPSGGCITVVSLRGKLAKVDKTLYLDYKDHYAIQ